MFKEHVKEIFGIGEGVMGLNLIITASESGKGRYHGWKLGQQSNGGPVSSFRDPAHLVSGKTFLTLRLRLVRHPSDVHALEGIL